MVKSLFVTASAGSGKTYRLTQEVRRHIERGTEFVVAATFTPAAMVPTPASDTSFTLTRAAGLAVLRS